MPRDLLLLAVCTLLLLCLVLTGVALQQSGDGRPLRARLRSLSPKGGTVPVLPSIRVVRGRRGHLSGLLLRLLRFDPDLPQAHSLPWPVVVLVTGAAGSCAYLLAADQIGRMFAVLTALASAALAARLIFAWQHARYANAVFQQIPDALGLMVRAIRAGLPLAEALRGVAREIASPTREEFSRVAGEMAIGRPVEEALSNLARRTGLTEYAFLAVTLGLQSQTGGSLAETLDNLADIVRKRVAMAKRAKALAAEANMQAGMLVVLPFVAALAMSFIQPFYIRAFTENPTGQTMAAIGLFLMLLGLLTIRWLIRQAQKG